MNTDLRQLLRQELPELPVRENVPFKEITSWGIGGSLPILAEPAAGAELASLCKLLQKHRIPALLLGGGTNLAGCDKPFDGVAIRLAKGEFSAVRVANDLLECGAAVRLLELAKQAAEAGFGGLAPLAGIPGTLGGALRMNAGAGGVAIGDFVVRLCGVRQDGSAWSAEKAEVEFGYRTSSIPADVTVTGAVLALPPGDRDAELEAVRQELAARKNREPAGRTAGCTFKNTTAEDPAGKLIDMCGLKGLRIGGCAVSEKHANYIINESGEASEEALIELIIEIRRKVAEKTGFFLEPEVVFADPDALERIHREAPAPAVTVLMGGDASEREVSLRSGKAVSDGLRQAGYPVTTVDLQQCRIVPEMRQCDVVFPIFHGGFGEGGDIQKLMEDAHITFVGSGSESCRWMMDKITCKRRMDAFGLPNAPWGIITTAYREKPGHLDFPVVVKAPCEGSTIGIEKVERAEEWDEALERLFQYDSVLLVEKCIKGRELTIPVVDGKVMPIVEIRSPHAFYDYDAKYVYNNGHTEYLCPAPDLPPELEEELRDLSLKFAEVFRGRGMFRIDYMLDENLRPYILEGNALPGCTATSLVPKAARQSGISFARMVAGLTMTAFLQKKPR
ncbi:MAG: UDP-N-acetylmuramate dehydrogenase [Lentisphaeria bacterium]|nr:UDP-N-acetylmuramate dehydrogenase [Lentisphaeria bacterium]